MYTYQNLGDEDRKRIHSHAAQIVLNALPSRSPGSEMLGVRRDDDAFLSSFSFSNLREDLQHGVYVVAMRKLGVKPAIPGERWRRLKNSPNIYVPLDIDAQKDAETYLLESHGIDVSRLNADTDSAKTANLDL